MAYETLLYDLKDGVLTITLNRPDKLNALSAQMLTELGEAFKEAEADAGARVVVLTGAGRGFCPGADLGDVQGRGPNFKFGDYLRKHYNPLILRMTSMAKPVIAGVNGVAAGAGMSLALACDLRIAVESAKFVQAFVNIGLVPDSGSTWLLTQMVGRTRALELMLGGQAITAPQALEWGILNRVASAEEFPAALAEMAAAYAKAPTRAIGYIKRSANSAATGTLEESLNVEADMQDLAGASADHIEGVTAFLQKRAAEFTGN